MLARRIEGRRATARGGVAQNLSRDLCVTDSVIAVSYPALERVKRKGAIWRLFISERECVEKRASNAYPAQTAGYTSLMKEGLPRESFLQKAARTGIAYLVLSGGMEPWALAETEGTEHHSDITIEQVLKSPPVPEAIIRNEVLNGKQEHQFVSFDDGKTLHELPVSATAHMVASEIAIVDILKVAKKEGLKKVLFAHTHPIEGYLQPEDQQLAREGKLHTVAMPPSLVDMRAHILEANEGKEVGVSVEGRVYGTSGSWEYRYDERAATITKEKLPEVFEALTQVEKNFFESLPRNLKERVLHSDQAYLVPILNSDPEFKPYLEKYLSLASELDRKFPITASVIPHIGALGREIAFLADSASADPKIDAYIGNTHSLGVETAYHPYPEKK